MPSLGITDSLYCSILLQKPAHAGSAYFNHKQSHSIVLLAISDCDYNTVIAFDVGAPGRIGEAGIFRRSTIKQYFSDDDDVFPPTREIGSIGAIQYHFLVDGGFEQDFRYVRGFAKTYTNVPEKPSHLVIALLVIHNLLSRRQDAMQVMERFPECDGEIAGLKRKRGSGGGGAANEVVRTIITRRETALVAFKEELSCFSGVITHSTPGSEPEFEKGVLKGMQIENDDCVEE
ncbi:hypothetical protein Aduo_001393 [Ancylostoma duodenale]